MVSRRVGLAGLVASGLMVAALVGSAYASSADDQPKKPSAHHNGQRVAAIKASTATSSEPYVLDAGIAKWYRDRGATMPLNDRPVYCHGYGCEFQTPVPIDDAALSSLQRIFAGHQSNAAEERKAISEAVRWWERRASPLTGGPPRKHGSDISQAHHLGSTDCIDEATNSTSILVILEQHGLLKFHTVQRPASRGYIVNAHSTAVIQEKGGEAWVVDMWMHDMGEAPDIMTLTQWYSEA